MYNLIVSGKRGAWESSRYELNRSRVAREYTVDTISERYEKLDDAAISELMSFPTLFTYERGIEEGARLGFIKEIRVRSGQVRFEYEFYASLPSIPAGSLDNLT